MNMKYTTITVSAKSYEDEDDCLEAAARDYASEHGLEAWEVAADWASDERDEIALTAPVEGELPEDAVIVETMPAHLRESHRRAGNWGRYPLNGAKRWIMSRADAEALLGNEPEYGHILRDAVPADADRYEILA
jgi:hypothetical protein